MSNFDDFAKLFDGLVEKSNDNDEEVDSALTHNENNEFEKLPFDKNVQKMRENVAMHKIGPTKALKPSTPADVKEVLQAAISTPSVPVERDIDSADDYRNNNNADIRNTEKDEETLDDGEATVFEEVQPTEPQPVQSVVQPEPQKQPKPVVVQEIEPKVEPVKKNLSAVFPDVPKSSVDQGKKVAETPRKVVESSENIDGGPRNEGTREHSVGTDTHSGEISVDNLTSINLSNWFFTSPSPKFDQFYKAKANAVQHISGSKTLPFEDYRAELRTFVVDISTAQFDPKQLFRDMEAIQKMKERGQELSMNVSKEFFMWKRFVELLRGYLAIVAYEKPAEKFAGVVYQHMGDVEKYFADLESIREEIMGSMKNLDTASAILSRQISMMIAAKEVPTKYGTSLGNSNPVENMAAEDMMAEEKKVEDAPIIAAKEEKAHFNKTEIKHELADFDQLDTTKTDKTADKASGPSTLKTGTTGWDIEVYGRRED